MKIKKWPENDGTIAGKSEEELLNEDPAPELPKQGIATMFLFEEEELRTPYGYR